MPLAAANRLVLPLTVFAQGLDELVFGHRGADGHPAVMAACLVQGARQSATDMIGRHP
jgi:hypothetical protein